MRSARGFLSIVWVIALATAACGGRVITPQPTAPPSPTWTVTPAPPVTLRLTATPPLLPPASTATPTLTPTPVVHVVQEGETLVGIAYQYGVSVQVLQTLNNIAHPQFLQIGQKLIIPPPEGQGEPLAGLLLPTPTPLPIGLQGVALYETPVGSLWCLGEVVNPNPDLALTNVQVRVALYDADGRALLETVVAVAADFIPPGARSPFGVLFTTPPQGWVSPQVSIVRSDAVGDLAEMYTPIVVSELTNSLVGSQFQVMGVVQNASADRAAESVTVIVTTYDAQGLVTGFRQEKVELAEPLAAGLTAPFAVLLSFHGSPPAGFNVVAVGRAPAAPGGG